MHLLSYFTDLQGSQTISRFYPIMYLLSYFTDLQGSQTNQTTHLQLYTLSYFTDLQGSQTKALQLIILSGLVTLLIYKVLKQRQCEG